MKIKYDLKGVQYSFYDFIQGVYLYRNRIRQNKVENLHGFTFHIVIAFILSFICFALGCLFMRNNINSVAFEMLTGVFTVLIILIAFGYLLFLFAFVYNKNKLSDGNIILDDNGITDMNKRMSITIKWEYIDFIAVKDDMVVIMPTNDFLMITFLAKESNKFIKNAKKYHKDLSIVRFD